MKFIKTNGTSTTFLAFALAAWAFAQAPAAQVTLQYESALSPNGPWQLVRPSDQTPQADGSTSLEADGLRYFRLRIQGASRSNAPAVVRLGSLPSSTGLRLTTRVPELSRFLRPMTRTGESNSTQVPVEGFAGVAAWQDATFASNAIPIYDPAVGNGAEPAYIEIKVTGPQQRVRSALDGTSSPERYDRGSILLSLGTSDVGIPYFGTEGETPVER